MADYIVQHRRGITENWAKHPDIIPEDGEIVLERCSDGSTRLRVGDGVHTFAQLSYLEFSPAQETTNE